MAQGNQPLKRNLAAETFRRNYTSLSDTLAQHDMVGGLARKLYSEAIITSETRDAVQTHIFTPTQQAMWLLQAVESSIKIDHTKLRKFTRVLKKQPVLEPIAKQLHQCYRELVSEVRLSESSSSGSDTDSTEQYSPQGRDILEAGNESSSATAKIELSMLGQCEPIPQDSGEACTSTRRKINYLEEKYLALVVKTQKEVMKLNPDLDEFRTRILLLPAALKEEHQQFLKDNLPQLYRAESIPEIFGLLGLYWNYLNYGLLQHIIQTYGTDDTKELMKCYIKDVKSFQQETTLAMFWDANPKQRCQTALRGDIVVALTSHAKLTSSSSLKPVDELRQKFACTILLSEFAIVLKEILPG